MSPSQGAQNQTPIDSARAQLTSLLGNQRGDLDFLDRFDRWAPDLIAGLTGVYDVEAILPRLIEILATAHAARDEALRARDRERVLNPDWFQRPDMIGYVCYTDLFNKNLAGLIKRIPYLKDLGVTYLHLMPVLKPRPGANDGGYAVMDYRNLREDLGTMSDLRATADALHSAGISLTLDLVLNHVALEHEWAEKARAGDATYREYFYVFDDRTIPDKYEKSLSEVFPDFAPGNFTWSDDLNGWVWTTFNSYQWDVNWSNPSVFCEYADVIANLANHGVDALRLDAIAFIWKRLGTACQNEDEVHGITEALRAFARILAPSLIFKAEAIVGPAQVGAYLGEGSRSGKVSDLAYHNSLMVQIWAAIAARDTGLMELALSRFHAIPNNTAWGVYLRCHDDIGWAIDDDDARRLGMNGHDHRMFLADYFNGSFVSSDARGVDFQEDPESGERRTSGTAASLAGIEAAMSKKDARQLDVAIDRYIAAYSMVLGFGGIPLIYMGDEIGLLNDTSFTKDPSKVEDNRWIHRPKMTWSIADAAARAGESDSVAARIRSRLTHVIAVRKSLAGLHASVATHVRSGRSRGVVIFDRKHPAGDIVQVYNLADETRWIDTDELGGLHGSVTDYIAGVTFDLGAGIPLGPYEVRWFTPG